VGVAAKCRKALRNKDSVSRNTLATTLGASTKACEACQRDCGCMHSRDASLLSFDDVIIFIIVKSQCVLIGCFRGCAGMM
jgi:hypothetical protein